MEFKLYQKRRHQLLAKLSEDSIVIVASGLEKKRNSDVDYPFRANSNFLYLTGINEPNCVAVLSSKSYILFVLPNNEKQEIWLGKHIGIEEAKNDFGVDEAFDIKKIAEKLPLLLKNSKNIYYNLNEQNTLNELIIKQQKTIIPLKETLEEMRVIKTVEEIEQMQHAINISINAHIDAMKQVKNCQFEHQVTAIFDYHFTYNNAQSAYGHIVAGGKNACILHYIKNNQKLKNDELLLIDAGCEVEGYASDITRTFPISGKFTTEQKAIYELVLEAQKQAIASIKPNVLMTTPHNLVVKVLTTGLIALGLLNGEVTQNIKKETYRTFFMHGTGHYLGLDVHDVGEINKSRLFEAGMVTTIEPGLYIKPNDNIDKKWWNIGVRIEDDILVTTTGHQNLTQNLIKEVADIEALMQE